MWVYWKEQCDCCVNQPNCQYEQAVRQYIKDIDAVPTIAPIYGSLSFKCDYCVVDEQSYKKKYPDQCDACRG